MPYPGTYRKCPECGSKHYKRGRSLDIDYIHDPPNPVRRVENPCNMPWVFECLECGYVESEW